MAINSRLRDEVLRRDSRRCHYCGADTAAVDYLTPENQGGVDTADNLVAACDECIEGRREALDPNAEPLPIVEPSAADMRAVRAMRYAVAEARTDRAARTLRSAALATAWSTSGLPPLPHGWAAVADDIHAYGLPDLAIGEVVRVVATEPNVANPFDYFQYVAWNRLRVLYDATRRIFDAMSADGGEI